MPNPWDAGSAVALERLGFKALATTSAGFAWTLGRADNGVTLDEALDHLARSSMPSLCRSMPTSKAATRLSLPTSPPT